MKKFLRSVVVLLFCLTLITSTATVSLAAGKVTGAKVSAVTYNSATLTWKKVKGADGYQVRYYADKKYSKTVDVKKKTTYKFKLTPGKSYSLEARAYEKKLKRFKTVYEYGSWAKVKVKAVPAQVKNLKGTQSGNSVKLTWSKTSDVTGYNVQQYVKKKWKTIATTTKNTYTVKKQKYQTTQQFRVSAYKTYKKKNYTGDYSSTVKVTLATPAPAQVTSLKATQSSTSAKLSWKKIDGVKGYQVQQYVSKKWKTIKTVTTNSYTVTGLKWQSSHQFRVRAYKQYDDIKVYGAYSSTAKLTIATPAPAQVTNLKATQSAKTVKLTWTAISGVKGYDVQQYKSGKWTTIKKDLTTNSLSVKDQAYQSTQQFRVRAYKMYDKIRIDGAYSSTVKITIATPAPAQVTSLKATQSASSVKLTWTAVSGAAGYTVQQYKSSKWTTIKTLTTNSYTVTKQAYQSTQQFRVCAYKMYDDIKVTGSYSSTASVTIAAPAPAAVTGFKAVQSGSSAKLTWTAVSGAAGYTVQQYKSSKWETIKSVTTNSYTVSSLTYGSTYKFRVCAYKMYEDFKSSSAYTSEASVTIATAKPSSFKLSTVATTSAKLTWGAVTGAKGYEVYNCITGETTTVTTNSFSLSTLSAGTAYKFKVRSYAGSYKSDYTAELSFVTVPAAVTDFSADVTETTAKIFWEEKTGCIAYQVQRYDAVNETWIDACADSANTSVTFSSLETNVAYKYRVRGYLKDGSTTRYSDWAEYTIKTRLPAPTLSNTGNTASELNISWTAVSDATQYLVESYKFTNSIASWVEVTKTTETNASITTSARESMLLRVSALSDDGTVGMYSNNVTATPQPITITTDAFSATVTWGDIENTTVKQGETVTVEIEKYSISNKILYENSKSGGFKAQETIKSADLDSYKLALTPGTVNAYQIYAHPKSGSPYKIASFAIDATGLTISDTDAGKNAQLLYLVNAINKTKNEQRKVIAKRKVSTDMAINYLSFNGKGLVGAFLEANFLGYYSFKEKAYVFDSQKDLLKFMQFADSSATEADLRTTDSSTNTYTFNKGKATTENNRTLYLENFLEPIGTSPKLQNVNNVSAWKDVFSAVNAVKNTDGTYTITATLKPESFGEGTNNTKPVHLSNFITSLDSLASEGNNPFGDGGEIKTGFKVGASTITAKITADGKLITYNVSIPTDMVIDTFISNEDMGGMGEVTLKTKMTGKETIDYTFTR